MRRCTTDADRSFYNSLLWASLKLSGIPGNVVALLALQHSGHEPAPAAGDFQWVLGTTANSGPSPARVVLRNIAGCVATVKRTVP